MVYVIVLHETSLCWSSRIMAAGTCKGHEQWRGVSWEPLNSHNWCKGQIFRWYEWTATLTYLELYWHYMKISQDKGILKFHYRFWEITDKQFFLIKNWFSKEAASKLRSGFQIILEYASVLWVELKIRTKKWYSYT